VLLHILNHDRGCIHGPLPFMAACPYQGKFNNITTRYTPLSLSHSLSPPFCPGRGLISIMCALGGAQVREWMLASDPRAGIDSLWPLVVIFALLHVVSTAAQVVLGCPCLVFRLLSPPLAHSPEPTLQCSTPLILLPFSLRRSPVCAYCCERIVQPFRSTLEVK